mmetsp:Transcript_22897/g.36537  ORF Transcript_22897/g.36537 Transcript_22897/m.36537 type:complete len:218 (+) Transcript_22897:39-692(+)
MSTELQQQTLTQQTLANDAQNIEAASSRSSDEEQQENPLTDNAEHDEQKEEEAEEEEEFEVKRTATLPPRITAPSPPSEPPPAVPKFDRRNTPKSPAPKPPSFPNTSSQSQLIGMGQTEMSKPVLHDYTQLACCLIFFFAWTGLIVVAYCKAKSAMDAYQRGDYSEYKAMNRQARSYMIFSVGLSMLIVLVVLTVMIVLSVQQAPDDAVPQNSIPPT